MKTTTDGELRAIELEREQREAMRRRAIATHTNAAATRAAPTSIAIGDVPAVSEAHGPAPAAHLPMHPAPAAMTVRPTFAEPGISAARALRFKIAAARDELDRAKGHEAYKRALANLRALLEQQANGRPE